MRNLFDQRGYVKPILTIAFIVILCIVAIKFIVPYYEYFSIKSEAVQVARLHLSKPERFQNMIYAKIEKMGLPIEKKSVIVIKGQQNVTIKTSWSKTVDIFGIYQKELKFELNVQE